MEQIVDFSDERQKRLFLNFARELKGEHRIMVVKNRPRRSDRQNRYYWPCFVGPFAEWCREMGNDWTDEDAHSALARKFLTKYITDERTGEMIESTRSTTALTTVEFNAYLDQCAQFLSEFCAIVVPEPTVYWEKE